MVDGSETRVAEGVAEGTTDGVAEGTTDGAAEGVLASAMQNFSLSARAYTKILKVSRTIADLDGAEEIRTEHVTEAIQYRSLDRNLWA